MVHNHNDEISTEADYISKCISEFYNSTSDEIRANCQALLENFYHRGNLLILEKMLSEFRTMLANFNEFDPLEVV